MPPEGLFACIAAFLVTSTAADALIRVAPRLGFLDVPAAGRDQEKKVHKKPVALLGGVALFLGIASCLLVMLALSPVLTSGLVTPIHYLGFLLGALVLTVGGLIDDRYDLPPALSFASPVLAAFIAVAAGVEVTKLTNPFGGILFIPHWVSNILVFVWLLVVTYTTKLLDGLDGLATGVTAVGTTMVLLLSLTAAYYQPDVAVFSSIVLGALLGFLVWNFHPAKMFLGEGGSTLTGYALATLAVISGGKLATALLAVGIPMLDIAWSLVRRVREGGWKQAFKGDRKHLHQRLLDLGWGQRRIVFSYYAVAAAFGFAALFLQSRQKLFALGLLTLAMCAIIAWILRYERQRT